MSHGWWVREVSPVSFMSSGLLQELIDLGNAL